MVLFALLLAGTITIPVSLVYETKSEKLYFLAILMVCLVIVSVLSVLWMLSRGAIEAITRGEVMALSIFYGFLGICAVAAGLITSMLLAENSNGTGFAITLPYLPLFLVVGGTVIIVGSVRTLMARRRKWALGGSSFLHKEV